MRPPLADRHFNRLRGAAGGGARAWSPPCAGSGLPRVLAPRGCASRRGGACAMNQLLVEALAACITLCTSPSAAACIAKGISGGIPNSRCSSVRNKAHVREYPKSWTTPLTQGDVCRA